LDKTKGRVFQYDQESKLLNIFGGNGDQMGGFVNPVAIDKLGDRVMVLDQDTGVITVFRPTEYGGLLETGVKRYNDGIYSEAKFIWEEVLRQNVNCELAYIGIGKALYEEGRYKDALEYFELGYDRLGYSRAYKEYRMETAKKSLPYMLTVGLALIVALFAYFKIAKLRKKGSGVTNAAD